MLFLEDGWNRYDGVSHYEFRREGDGASLTWWLWDDELIAAGGGDTLWKNYFASA